jgi:Ser/Thr protein kinase RdoA (MazF antagonist)
MLQDEIASRYGAQEIVLREIRAGQGGAMVFEAVLDGTRRALRISGPYLSARPGWIEFEGRFLEVARAEGGSVAGAVKGLDGRFGQMVAGGVAFLTEWAEGDIEWPTPAKKAECLGAAVAHLHLVGQEVEVSGDLRSFGTDGLLDRPMSLLGEIADVTPLLGFVDELRERIDAIPVTQETFTAIHGDVHQGNCHFDGDQATLFDFAQCGVGWRAFDLAGFLWPWRDASIERVELRIACDAYLKGYQTSAPLGLEELAALPAFVRARDLWEAGEWIATGDGREKADDVKATVLAWKESWSASPLRESLD